MIPRQLRRLIGAPEIVLVDLADATIAALRRAILVEHPTLYESPLTQACPVLRRAASVLRSAARLRRDLQAYRNAVDVALNEPAADDLPF